MIGLSRSRRALAHWVPRLTTRSPEESRAEGFVDKQRLQRGQQGSWGSSGTQRAGEAGRLVKAQTHVGQGEDSGVDLRSRGSHRRVLSLWMETRWGVGGVRLQLWKIPPAHVPWHGL